MTEQRQERPSETAAATSPPPSERGRTRGRLGAIWWLLPALTFIVGLVLGAVVVGAVTSGADSGGAASGASSTGSAAPSAVPGQATSPAAAGDVTVTVPAACAALAQDGRQAADLLTQAAAAARDLDASRLADIARQMQGLRSELSTGASACTGTDVTGGTPTATS